MHNRIKAIREELGLSQKAFGEKIGVSRDVINNLESNRVPLKEILQKHICEIYSVNENWLTTGEGNMFIDKVANKKLQEAMSLFNDLQPSFQDFALEQIKKLLELQEQK